MADDGSHNTLPEHPCYLLHHSSSTGASGVIKDSLVHHKPSHQPLHVWDSLRDSAVATLSDPT